jgi:polar amino acid transport system substrate-binding protein
MKKQSDIKYYFLVLFTLISFQAQASKVCSKLTYTAHTNYPPFHWEMNGHIVGATHDVAQIIFDRLGIQAKSIVVGPWKRVLLNAKHGIVDLVLGLKKTPIREQYLQFTDVPLFQNPVAVFVAKNKEFPFANWEDLINKRGNLNAGDRFGKEFDTFTSQFLTTHRTKGLENNFKMLLKNRADYFITGYYSGKIFLSTVALKEKISILPHYVLVGPIHFGFSKRSKCAELVDDFNRELQNLMDSNVIDEILENNYRLWNKTMSL